MTVETPPAPQLLSQIIPAEFHDRAYIKDWLTKPQDAATFAEFFKKHDNLESLVGKKVGIPADGATPEELEGFFAKMRPGKPEEYEILAKPGAKPDPEFAKELQAAFFAGGIKKEQAKLFQTAFMGSLEKRSAAMQAAQKQADAQFEEMVKTAHGEKGKEVMARVNGLLKELTPEPWKPHVEKLDNNALAILTGVVNAIFEKYATEDELKPKGTTNAPVGDDLQAEAMKLMQSKEYTDPFHPDHEKTAAKVREMFQEIAKARKTG